MSKKKRNKGKAHIETMDLYDMFRDNFYDYGMSVIKSRAIPDIRDGLKPVHRAIIFEMLNSKVTSKDRYSKVAKITGAVIGNWHPHGDMAVEDALAGLAVPWKNTLPVIDIAGNQGSVYGDPAAAGRYIEARLSPAGDSFGRKLKEGVVPYVNSFDDTDRMPKVLPAQLPFLLINGIADGIAVGVASSLPPHNAGEVMDMTLAYLKNPKIKLDELLEIMPGPDFPTGATIINKDELKEMYETGYGKISVRAKLDYNKKEHTLNVREIPYLFSGSMDNLVSEIVRSTTETGTGRSKKPPKIKGVREVEDHSGKDGMDISIQLQKDVDKDIVIQTLYAHTRLEATVKFNFNALNNKVLNTYSLRQYLHEYTDFQHEIVKNEHMLEKKDLDRRIEIIQGRIIASKLIDEIVDVVKMSDGRAEILEVLTTGKILKGTNKDYHDTVKTFQFSEVQAESIANISLYQLNRLDSEKLVNEAKRLNKRLKEINKIIDNKKYRLKLIIERLEKERNSLGETPRRTKIIQDEPSRAADIKVPLRPMYISLDRYGYISIDDSKFDGATKTDNKSRIGFFDTSGNCWNLYMDQAKPTKGRGDLTSQIFDLENGDRIIGFINPVSDDSDDEILFIYNDGRLKRTEISRFMTKSRSTRVNTRDAEHKIHAVYKIPTNATQTVINNKRYNLSDIPLQTNAAQGKLMMKPIKKTEENLVVDFIIGEAAKTKDKANEAVEEDIFDAVVIFDDSDTCSFDWSTTDTSIHDGLYVTTYQELIKQTLVFVHDDGTAKRVEGTEFEVKNRRSNLRANKKGLKSIYIDIATDKTLIGKYEDGYYKRIDEKEISTQSKQGGGVRVFYSTDHKLEEVIVDEDSKLEVVSFATQPKQID